MGSDIYTVLHHTVDKLGARDEQHLRDLHDTITAQQLGYGSLEELRAEQHRALIAQDPAAAAAAQKQAYELLATVREQQKLIETLLTQAGEYQRQQAAQANQQVADAQAQADPNAAPVFPTAPPAGPPAEEPPPAAVPASGLGPVPAIPIAPAAPASEPPAEAPARQVPLPPTSQP